MTKYTVMRWINRLRESVTLNEILFGCFVSFSGSSKWERERELTGHTTYREVYWTKTAFKLNLIVLTIILNCYVFHAAHKYKHARSHIELQLSLFFLIVSFSYDCQMLQKLYEFILQRTERSIHIGICTHAHTICWEENRTVVSVPLLYTAAKHNQQ